MAVTVGTLTIDLKANTASFSGSMDKMSQLSTKTATDVKRSLEKIAAAGVAMAVAVAGATAGLVVHALDAADAMGKMAEAVGTTTETLSVLSYAASLSNVSTEDLGKGLEKLAKAAFGAQNGNRELSKIFERLGVTVKTSDGHLKDSGLLMEEVAVKFAAMGTSSGKTALAMSLFGKSGATLIPMLNQYGGAQKQITEEAEKFGLVLSSDTASAAGDTRDNLDRLTAAAKGFGFALVGAVLPELSKLLDQLIEVAKAADIPALAKTFGSGVSASIHEVGAAVQFTRENFELLKNVIEGLAVLQIVKFALPLLADAAATGSFAAGVVKLGTSFFGLGKVLPILANIGKWLMLAIPMLAEAGGVSVVFSLALAAIGGPVTLIAIAVTALAGVMYAFRDSTVSVNGELVKMRDIYSALVNSFKRSVKNSFSWNMASGGDGPSSFTEELKKAKAEREAQDAATAKAASDATAKAAIKKPGADGPNTAGLGKPEKDVFGDALRKLDQSISAQKAYIAALGATPDKIQAITSAERAKAMIVELSNKLIDEGRLKEGQLLSASQQSAIKRRVASEDSLKAIQEYGKSLIQQRHDSELSLQQTTAMGAAVLLGDEAVRRATVDNMLLGLSYLKTTEEQKQFKEQQPALRAALLKASDAQALTQYETELVNLQRTTVLATAQTRLLATANLQGDEAVRRATIDNALLGLTYNKTAEEIKAMDEALEAIREAMKAKASVEMVAGANSEVHALTQENIALRLVGSAILGTIDAQREAELESKLYTVDTQLSTLADGEARNALLRKKQAMVDLAVEQMRQADLQAALALRSPLELYKQEIDALDHATVALAGAEGGTLTYGQSLEVLARRQEAFNKLTDAQIDKLLRFGSARDGVKAFFLEMQKSAESAASIIYTALNMAFDRVSANLTDLITTGKAEFGKMLTDIGKQLLNSTIKAGLQIGINAIGKKLGLAVKRDGSDAAHALFVQDVTSASSLDKVADAKMHNAIDAILGIEQQKLIDPTGAANFPYYVNVLNFPQQSSGGGISSFLGSLAGSLIGVAAGGLGKSGGGFRTLDFGGARAGGGSVSPSSAYLVGDNGPEILMRASGSIMSNTATNRMLSGSVGPSFTYSIDARGTDPVLTEQRTRAGIIAAHNSSVVTSLQLQKEQLKRTPQR